MRSLALVLLAAACGCRSAEKPGAPEPPPAAASVEPARRPHAEYPTPAMAGTEQLFLLEEPPRGPHVTQVRLPERASLRFAEHAHCEVGLARLVCSGARPRPGAGKWIVGRSDGRVALAERNLPSGRLVETYLFDWESGKLARLVALDEHGVVEWTRSYNPSGERYTERLLTGANNLPGCGALALRGSEAACLQWGGSPMRDTNGVGVTVLRHDWQGFVVERTHLGTDRKPVAGHDGVHRTVIDRDAAGRVLARVHYDLEGKVVVSTSDGCSGRRFRHDERGIVVEETCLGKDGAPAAAEEGVAVTVYEINADGCAVAQRRLDREGQPTHVRGIYGVVTQPDPWCEPLAVTCTGAEGEAVPCSPEGPARIEYERDEKGRPVVVRHRGPDGDPGRDPEYGVFELRKSWDALGNLVEETCWGASGEPVECDHTGFHGERITVDEVGRTREVRYFDVAGEPTTNLGVGVRRYGYDNYDHLRVIHGFGLDGDVLESLGMHVQSRLYDPGHRLFALLLFDKAGKPARYTGCFTGRDCPARDWHAVRIFRGANGRVTRNAYFDADGQLIENIDCDSRRCW
jgi:hypothetical protein